MRRKAAPGIRDITVYYADNTEYIDNVVDFEVTDSVYMATDADGMHYIIPFGVVFMIKSRPHEEEEEVSEAQLFEWEGIPEKRERKPKPVAEVVPFAEPWKLMGRRANVVGFHLPQSVNKHGTVVALCGQVGRAITHDSTQMVRCDDCIEADNTNRREAQ